MPSFRGRRFYYWETRDTHFPDISPTRAYIEWLHELPDPQRRANITRAVNNLKSSRFYSSLVPHYDDDWWGRLYGFTLHHARTNTIPQNMASKGRRWFYL